MEFNQDARTKETISTISEEEQSYAQSSTGLLKPEKSEMYNKLLGVILDNQSDEFLVNLSELSNYVKCLPVTK